MGRFFRWCRGYLTVRCHGVGQERFINICNNKGIRLKCLEYGEAGYNCEIDLSDYKKLRPVARKSRVVPYAKKRHGLPFIIAGMRKHIILTVAVLLFFSVFFYLSNILWNISVEGGSVHTEEQLEQYLADRGISVGVRLSTIDCGSIEEDMRISYPDIGWVSAELLGTKLILRINEVRQPERVENPGFAAANLIASRDGTIASITTTTGKAVVKAGDSVSAGQLLVSGIIEVYGDNEVLLREHLVLAEASIKLNTVYKYNRTIKRRYKAKMYTGDVEKGFGLSLFGKKIISYNYGNSYDRYDIISQAFRVRLFDSFLVPVELVRTRASEYEEVFMDYTDEELLKKAKAGLSDYLQRLLEKRNGRLLLEEVKYDIKADGCIASGQLWLEEEAWRYEPLHASARDE